MRRTGNLFAAVFTLALGAVSPAWSTPGDTVRSIPVPACCPTGLTSDGDHLWLADRRTDMLYQLDAVSGTVLDSLPAPAYSPTGLTWDGSHLWVVDADEKLLYAVNPETRIVERTLWCPVSRPGDLAWDGEYLWICDDGSDEIHKLSTEDGTTMMSFEAPSSHPGGLAFDGTYLWVSDRYKDMVYMVWPATGDVVLSLHAPGSHPTGLTLLDGELWVVDYQDDRVYQVIVEDGTLFSREEPRRQQLDFIHQVRCFGPDSAKTVDVYLSVPQNMNNQKLLGEVLFDPAPTEIVPDQWGQPVAHFRFTDLAAGEHVEVSSTARVELYENRYFVRPERVGGLDDIPGDIRATYLVDNSKFALGDAVIQKGVKAAVGDETNPYWIARKLYNYVIDHIEYELAGGWNIAPTVLERGTGSCSEYSFVYIALCRAAGLPARYVGSVAVRGDDASWDNVFHRWVEIYLPGYDWVPVDPSGGDSDWPAARADAFGFLQNRFLITTAGGGGSDYLEWDYNANERFTTRGRCKMAVENFGEWSPLPDSSVD